MTPTPAPICPKCGYDQSGAIATWEARCPIAGVCTECGETLKWAQVFRIQQEWGSEVGWYAEHARNKWEMFDRTPGTLVRLVYPLWYFRTVTHRRKARIPRLIVWLITLNIAMHLIASSAGYAAHRSEGYAGSMHGGPFDLGEFLDRQLTEIPSAVLYPFAFVRFDDGAWDWQSGRFSGEDWAWYMILGWVMVGTSLFWIGVVGYILLVRLGDADETRRELRLLIRVALLSLIPLMVYIQAVRAGFGIHAATGMTESTDWVYVGWLILILVGMFWQQLLWTRAIREYFRVRRSFVINVLGCFASMIFGIIFLIMK